MATRTKADAEVEAYRALQELWGGNRDAVDILSALINGLEDFIDESELGADFVIALVRDVLESLNEK
jgi:hypothetical protein